MSQPQPPIRAPHRSAIAALLLGSTLLLGTTLGITSCASTGAGSAATGTPLERLAHRQLNRPVSGATAAPPPANLHLDPIDRETNPEAFATLDEAIEHFSAQPLPAQFMLGAQQDEGGAVTVTKAQRESALRRYIAGRSALIGDDLTGAIQQLDAASALDPNEPQIWRALADAHWLTGDRLAAIASYLRAIDLRDDDTVSLMRVGLSERDRRSHDTAAIFLTRAYATMRRGDDAAIPYIVGISLGRTLHELGWMNAGNEAIFSALDELEVFSQPTSYRRELSAALRGAGDAWRDSGDASVRLGAPADALDAYRRASQFPSFDPAALLTRRVYANMQLGRPAGAAVLLVDRISTLKGLVDDRTLELIRYLSGASAIGADLAGAIRQVEESLDTDERRIAASQLARAKAAALPDAQAIAVLIDRLVISPADESAVADLLNRRAPTDAPGLVAMVSQLIESNTIEARRYADALLRYAPDVNALLSAINASGANTPGENLLGAALAYEIGEEGAARSMLRDAITQRPDDAGVIIAQAQLAIAAGASDEGRSLLKQVNTDENQAAALAVARAYRDLGDNQTAIAILDDRVWGGDATAEEALVAGEISVSMGAPIDAEQLLKLAIELDPTLEDAYAALIALYQNNGMLASQANLGDTLRALRDAIPSSQTLRWLRVQDLLRADRLGQAQRELLSLAEESLDPVVVEQLISVWIRTSEAATAERWLKDQIALRPNRGVFSRLLARVHAAQGDTSPAIRLLESWLATHPTDDSASRELENILRLESVGRTDDANALALKRLSREAPSTRRSIELAPILVAQGQVPEAIRTLAEPLTMNLRIDPSQMQEYASYVLSAATSAAQNAKLDPEVATQGLGVLALFLDRYPESPVDMHRTLTGLLIQTDAEPERIARSAVATGRAAPEKTGDFVLEAATTLYQRGKFRAAMQVATHSARMMPSAPPMLKAYWLTLARFERDEPTVLEALSLIERDRDASDTLNAFDELHNRELGVSGVDEEQSLGELYYICALAFDGANQDEITKRFYRQALQHNPRHAMANNNLAYGWVVEGVNLDRAHEMLQIAHEEDPGSEAIADSLGWVRYKLGMIDDQRNAEGEIVMQGAVSILTAAYKLDISKNGGTGLPEILDHLADAHWRIGQTDRSIEAWRQARLTLIREIDILEDLIKKLENEEQQFSDGQSAQLEFNTTLLSSIDAKLDAVANGEVPALSPMLRPRRWTQEHPQGAPQDGRVPVKKPEHSQGAPL